MGVHQRAESTGLVSSLLCALVAMIVMALYTTYASAIWMVTRRAFGVASAVTAGSGVIAFVIGYVRRSRAWNLKRGWLVPIRRAVEMVALAIVYASTVFLTTYAILGTMNGMMGSTMFIGYLTWATAGFSAITGYVVYVQAELMTAKTLASLLPLFVVAGVTTAGLTTDDPYWWHNNFSQLGDRTTFAATMFNATLILAGLSIIIISYFAVSELSATHRSHRQSDEIERENRPGRSPQDLEAHDHDMGEQDGDDQSAADAEPNPTKPRRRPSRLRGLIAHWDDFRVRTTCLTVLLTGSGITFIGIGAFRYTPHPVLHNVFAQGMPVFMAVLMVALPWLAPQLSRTMYVASDLMIALNSLAGLIWLRGAVTLTNVEALTAFLFLAWFIIFSRQIAAIEADRLQAQMQLVERRRALRSPVIPGEGAQSRLTAKR